MAKRLLLFIFLQLVALPLWSQQEIPVYKGQQNSLIQWENVKAIEYLDFAGWKKDTLVKLENPGWEIRAMEKRQKELVGRFMECIGTCEVYKGQGYFRAKYRSSVHEGDEVFTQDDSYAWLYLLDGTLLRMSPNTSVTVKEINIGVEKNFLHVRLNSGNILWWGRQGKDYVEQEQRETDTLFLPLELYEANISEGSKTYSEDNLFAILEDESLAKKQYQRLNVLMKENNEFIQGKKTEAFLVMPNGTIQGHDLIAEFIVLLGGKSFFKIRNWNQIQLKEEKIYDPITFTYRGLTNVDTYQIEPGVWYEVDERGRAINRMIPNSLMNMGEFLTKRIPTILIARELLIKKYSQSFFGKIDHFYLAEELGYRLWQSPNSRFGVTDLEQRVAFLLNYTRRVETTNLLTSSRFREQLERRGETLESMVYGPSFFEKALTNYAGKRETSTIFTDTDREVLNSTKKKYWKIINERRFK